jgi:mono/diheme cytochrome c family protein
MKAFNLIRSAAKRQRSIFLCVMLGVLVISLVACATPAALTSEATPLERGRYLVTTTGCNDCHTAGYTQSEGKVPEEQWLTGDTLGHRGPWGTTYPPNLRLFMQDLTEDQWVTEAKNLRRLPPMPWYNLNIMTEEDLRAMYQYISSLEPNGNPAPAYLPPDQEPPPPYIQYPNGP